MKNNENSTPTALVTGAGRGIGRAIALALAHKGFAVGVNDLDANVANAVCAEITALGGKVTTYVADIANPEAVTGMMEAFVAHHGGITALVNNAGIVRTSSFWDIPIEEWDLVMKVDLRSVFLACKAAFPYMKQAGYGKIINMASVAGLLGGGLLGNAAYAAAKAGVIAFTKGVAREAGPLGIRANVIAPALTDTEMTCGIDPEKRQGIIRQIPLGRAGLPEDIANAVVFLASPESDFISGETLIVDGGFMRR
ncbi:SDR family NAD(P)-dependent oxidoreductase [Desulfovibrio cuneatus]|uniref:SDR family NAD(P)-dependent oxidoreductase n=1 Tax=Desulfovibrio cuneatus TaxID=159728 RepID=UPI0003FC4CBF|nr:3-oxoacyl-ACP reductase FabG [Desulfovibrio cuneatus]